jgi:Fic-DOC domain mobile mystery protein B
VSEPPEATPLDPDEAEGLRLSYIATREELDAAEAENIAEGLRWAINRRLTADEVLDDIFLRELHRRMFSTVWRWAGTYRKTEKNIGVDPATIADAVRNLAADSRVWAANIGSPASWNADEVAVRFHHRLVSIHPFPNGNGRHSRAAADLIIMALGAEPFGWGRGDLSRPTEVRARYIQALQTADRGEYPPLLEFARS